MGSSLFICFGDLVWYFPVHIFQKIIDHIFQNFLNTTFKHIKKFLIRPGPQRNRNTLRIRVYLTWARISEPRGGGGGGGGG
jgi:hypothetical protein